LSPELTPETRADRARELWLLVAVVFFGLLLRLGYLQLVRGGVFEHLSEENRIRSDVLRAERGRILDRNGVILADNYPTYRLTLDPRDRAFRGHPEALARVVEALAEVLERDPAELAAEVDQARRRWGAPLLLSRNLSFAQLSQLEERQDRLAGVDVQPESMRRYPRGTLACHVLGHLGEISEEELKQNTDYRMGDLVGRAGLERQYEKVLRGRDGVDYVSVDALGRRTDRFPELPARPAEAGADLVLTLDAQLQEVAERALDAIPRHGHSYPRPDQFPPPDSILHGPPSALVALDPRTGEVLALASRPPFDPNVFVRGLSKEDWRQVNASTHPLLNRAVQASYPPGSVFKILTALAGLEEGVITPERRFSGCGGGYFYGNRVFRCWRKAGHGALNLTDALTRSCDVYFYQLGIALGVARMGRFGEKIRIAERTGIDLPQERAGLMPTPEWYHERYGKGGIGGGAALNISIGQGEVLLTPLQVAHFIGTVAAGGKVMRPHLLRRIESSDGQVQRDALAESWEEQPLGVSPANLRILVAAMERVVMDNSGTGGRARVGEFRIGGKTGTAQNPHGDDHAVFAAFATVDQPRIVVAVVAEESGHGGSVAAPVAQRVLYAFLTGEAPPVRGTSRRTPAGPLVVEWEGD